MKRTSAVLPNIAMIWLSSYAGACWLKRWEMMSDDDYLLGLNGKNPQADIEPDDAL